MRVRVVAVLFLAGTATVTLSLLRGQERPVTPTPSPQAAPAAPAVSAATPPRQPQPAKLTAAQQDTLLAAQRGAGWTSRMLTVKGHFAGGHRPALAQEMEGGHYVRQIHAALALARAARLTGEDGLAARATQAVLFLLEETSPEENDNACRHVALPPVLVNRVHATGLLVLAICELPSPQKDLLDKAEQMCGYLRKQARTDGSIAYHDGKDEPDGVNQFPAAALCALAVSQRHRPAEWKTDLVKKALPYYRDWWTKSRSLDFVPLMSAAFAETHARSKDRACADFVFAMNDWLCGLQYVNAPQRVSWHGGFKGWQKGQAVESMPTVEDAAYAESLAQACRCARDLGDVGRFQRYAETAENAVKFLETLQYVTQNTNHYAEWYRPYLLGGFHHSHQDGNVRIDQSSRATSALLACLEHVWRQ